ncbi:PREDICTED: uncharacterized protein LOC109342542 isoform X2 [Lupinus angustifolius]|uniref:uncharacterized protein LOC109342542 isoform X2 n=1 Tax=Lupinus angustifolius TaxID=3871 RepID=UPI00092F894E|nr:PREDICTED: uncharacterized protein LOC109342542 isoform X2 [Lupinus angustifolius]
MDISTSQFNSASESGWTHYLDQSTFSENHFQKRNDITNYEEKGERMEESEEDLSMVSDASSGPPHYDDECYSENWCTYLSSTSKESQKKKKVKEYSRNQKHSTLDDTASSPFFNFPKESHKKQNGAVENAMDFSQCLSSTRIKRKPKFQKNFRGTQASEEPGCLNEEQRK